MSEEEIKKIKEYIEAFNKVNWVAVTNRINELEEENKQLKEQLEQRDEVINEVINKLQLIIVIGFDYDGFNQVESLKTLIDELINYAKESRDILTNIQRR